MSGGLFRIEELPGDGAATVRVPVMGQSLCAGFPSPAEDFQEQAIELPRWLVPKPVGDLTLAHRRLQHARCRHPRWQPCLRRAKSAPGHSSIGVAADDGCAIARTA